MTSPPVSERRRRDSPQPSSSKRGVAPQPAATPASERRGGRLGSWRSSASCTRRPTSCPSVMRGSTCESSPRSCSSPCRHSASIVAFSSWRPSPSGRTRSAGGASSGSRSASIRRTCRALLPAASSTSFCRPTASSTSGGGSGSAGGNGTAGRSPPPASPPVPVERPLQLRGGAQRQRAVAQPLPRVRLIGAQPRGADAPSGGRVAVAELAHRVVEQAGEASLQIQAARLDLGQVVDDGALQVPFVADQVPGLPQQLAVGEGADGGGDRGPGGGGEMRGIHTVNILLVLRYTSSPRPGPAMNLRAARAEPGAVQPTGHVSSSEAGRGWNVRWRASSQAQNPVKSPRQDFSTFFAPVRVPQCRRQGTGIRNREPRRGGGRHRLLRVILLRDTVRCHSRLGVFGARNLYPPVFM